MQYVHIIEIEFAFDKLNNNNKNECANDSSCAEVATDSHSLYECNTQ